MIYSKVNAVSTANTKKEKPKFTTTPKLVEKKVANTTKKSRTKREEPTE